MEQEKFDYEKHCGFPKAIWLEGEFNEEDKK